MAFSLDRLSRDPGHGSWLVEEVTSHGGVILTPDIPADLDTPTGDFQFGILLQVAKLYRAQAGARFEGAKERAIRNGIAVGPIPFGYRKRPDRTMEVDPDTAPIIEELFQARVKGAGWGELAKLLADRTGRVWSKQAVPRIIGNPTYHTGKLYYGEWESERSAGQIVDEALWHAAQRRPTNLRDGRSAKAKWLLSGLLKCESCGHGLIPWTPSTKARRTTANRYRCNYIACPDRISIHAPAAHDLVTEQAFADSLALQAAPAETAHLGDLEEKLADAQRRFEQIATPEMQDSLGELWPAQVKERRDARDSAAAALGEARSASGQSDSRLYNLGQIWDDLSPDQQRIALRNIYSEVRVAKVPRGEKPSLTFVPATGPFRPLEYAPVNIIRN